MIDCTFKAPYVPYRERFVADLIILYILGILSLCVYIYKQGPGIWAFVVVFALLLLCTYVIISDSKSSINEVRITDSTLTVSGFDRDRRWEKKFKIQGVQMKVIMNGRKLKGKGGIIIRLTADKQDFDIDTRKKWDAFDLIEIFKQLKSAKGERIIVDEKIRLITMERLANGYSALDMGFQDKNKK